MHDAAFRFMDGKFSNSSLNILTFSEQNKCCPPELPFYHVIVPKKKIAFRYLFHFLKKIVYKNQCSCFSMLMVITVIDVVHHFKTDGLLVFLYRELGTPYVCNCIT